MTKVVFSQQNGVSAVSCNRGGFGGGLPGRDLNKILGRFRGRFVERFRSRFWRSFGIRFRENSNKGYGKKVAGKVPGNRSFE